MTYNKVQAIRSSTTHLTSFDKLKKHHPKRNSGRFPLTGALAEEILAKKRLSDYVQKLSLSDILKFVWTSTEMWDQK